MYVILTCMCSDPCHYKLHEANVHFTESEYVFFQQERKLCMLKAKRQKAKKFNQTGCNHGSTVFKKNRRKSFDLYAF